MKMIALVNPFDCFDIQINIQNPNLSITFYQDWVQISCLDFNCENSLNFERTISGQDILQGQAA